ncbi:hypothetical protein Pvag_pPag20215 (plasmid) [Pantoea vagans C9-1]|nr:hypothetical protein Pvag_pPag20215 [Pantoea vagans C9-1]
MYLTEITAQPKKQKTSTGTENNADSATLPFISM